MGDTLAAGTAQRSGNIAPLEVVAGGMVAVGEDGRSVLDLARPALALCIGGMGTAPPVNLASPASYVRERVEAFRESGVTNVQVTPLGDDLTGLVRQLKERVG
ncbi:hypothetical protein [Streptomyces canus]|uniref:hypothetical protein n=1 Tax=Streptomyces canus TaxID=58343 RepID=UPI00035FF06A|nr:hypothetical protein [Streptomyces canus]